ncbi:Small GTPase like protein [Aduncisulcus paluster]|uniref:Small GTPase like protein n=1 Tax=Aduncisulcus paluster TaxID=2918883 RepID=A0ABQ5KWP1_9EUKA|nr:Small GTPase like protein [Aduncisulcus paluster]
MGKFKVVFLGQGSAGKTSIINRFIYSRFDVLYHPTLGIDFLAKSVYLEDKVIRLQVWDTAGQERFKSLVPSYIRDCSAAIVVYDVTSRESFDSIRSWVEQVRERRGDDAVIFVVGNKIDLEAARKVSEEEGRTLASSLGCEFGEVSAKQDINITAVMKRVAYSLPTEADGEPAPEGGEGGPFIPRYIINLFDEDYKGVYGFCTEFCIGGNVKSFSRSWCVGCKCRSLSLSSGTIPSNSDSSAESASKSEDSIPTPFDPMTLDPLRVSALCVGMIECFSKVHRITPYIVHRAIKPQNFSVPVNPKNGKCTIVLSAPGLARIQEHISDPYSIYSITAKHKPKSLFGYKLYMGPEALRGHLNHEGDAYSLGLTLFGVFESKDPFVDHLALKGITNRSEYFIKLEGIVAEGKGPKLCECNCFKTLKTIEDGKFNDERMSVHEACEKVQSIKPLLPKIGEGWECPSIDDIVKPQLAKHKGDSGCIVDDVELAEKASLESVYDLFGGDFDPLDIVYIFR